MARKDKVILGIHVGVSSSSAAIVVNGQLEAALEETPGLQRNRHLFPHQAVTFCLRRARTHRIGKVALSFNRWDELKTRLHLWFHPPRPTLPSNSLTSQSVGSLVRHTLKKMGLGRPPMLYVPHHWAHLFDARASCPATEAALLSLDGMGGYTSALGARAMGFELTPHFRILYPHSLGYFYCAMAQFLGFDLPGSESHVMEMAQFGSPRYASQMQDLIREGEDFSLQLNLEAFPLLHHPPQWVRSPQEPVRRASLFNAAFLTQFLGLMPRKEGQKIQYIHTDLACSVQKRFEEVGNHLAASLHDRVWCDHLALSGGCAQNSAWVGQLTQNTGFKQISVPPAPHNAGLAIGSAFAALNDGFPKARYHNFALVGPLPEDPESEQEFLQQVSPRGEMVADEKKLARDVAKALADGLLVGLFMGAMEFGRNGLGNRSVLADPRSLAAKKKLDSRFPQWESYQSYSVACLWEYQNTYFPQSFLSPYQHASFMAAENKRSLIPAALQAKGTCRLQSVTEEMFPFLWSILNAFREKTDIPLLLTAPLTSNLRPVMRARDAWDSFMSSEVDWLVFGQMVFRKAPQHAKKAA